MNNQGKRRGPAPKYRSFNLQLLVEMFEETKAKAAANGMSMQRYIRMSLAGTTGVSDRSLPWTPPGARTD